MSADNYVIVDHDGTHFTVEERSASCEPNNPPMSRTTVHTEKEVEAIIDRICIIEYGVDWTAAARAVCGAQKCPHCGGPVI